MRYRINPNTNPYNNLHYISNPTVNLTLKPFSFVHKVSNKSDQGFDPFNNNHNSSGIQQSNGFDSSASFDAFDSPTKLKQGSGGSDTTFPIIPVVPVQLSYEKAIENVLRTSVNSKVPLPLDLNTFVPMVGGPSLDPSLR